MINVHNLHINTYTDESNAQFYNRCNTTKKRHFMSSCCHCVSARAREKNVVETCNLQSAVTRLAQAAVKCVSACQIG
jgi:hypothetical protein